MLKYLLPLVFLCMPHPAQASSWMECKGTGEVQKVQKQDDGTYLVEARVIEAMITDGMAAIGESCIFGVVPVIVEISSPEAFDIEAVVPLKYISYGAMGPEGPVSSQTWSLDTKE